jgi:hypothetical protein
MPNSIVYVDIGNPDSTSIFDAPVPTTCDDEGNTSDKKSYCKNKKYKTVSQPSIAQKGYS